MYVLTCSCSGKCILILDFRKTTKYSFIYAIIILYCHNVGFCWNTKHYLMLKRRIMFRRHLNNLSCWIVFFQPPFWIDRTLMLQFWTQISGLHDISYYYYYFFFLGGGVILKVPMENAFFSLNIQEWKSSLLRVRADHFILEWNPVLKGLCKSVFWTGFHYNLEFIPFRTKWPLKLL